MISRPMPASARPATAAEVLFDANQLSGQLGWSGIGTYERHLLAALAGRGDVRVTALARDDAELPDGIARRRIRRFLTEGRVASCEHETRRAFELRRAAGVVFHNPSIHPPLVVRRPWVQTLHDVIPLVYDDPSLAVLRQRFRRFGPRYRRADTVIAVSRHAAGEGARWFGLDPARVEVVYHGIGPEFTPSGDQPADPPYVSVVGEYARRKGFDKAFEVVAAMADAGLPHRLVVAGRIQVWLQEEFERTLRAAPRPDLVEVRGFVPDLVEVYRGAAVHLMTSRYEGFGFPALEAMACGVPVVAFANSSLPEVVGDAAIVVPDGDVPAMAAAAIRLVKEPALRAEYSQAGVERARQFSWEASAAAHAEIYRRVAEEGG
jgi:glycosyltransferase involved in cell wall biosynthesis